MKNQYQFPILYSRTSTGATQVWSIEVDGNKFRVTSGHLGGKKIINEWTICLGKNEGKKNETSGEEQALKEAKSKWDKQISQKGYFQDINSIDQITYFEPMLAKKFGEVEYQYPVYTQPKLDGLRCVIKSNGMWSRNGKPIVSVPHIMKVLQPLFDENPNLVFDGELFCDKLKNDFEKIISLAKKSKPTTEDLIESEKYIQYWVYDFPSCDKTFGARWIELNDVLKNIDKKSIRLTPTYFVNNKEELDGKYQEFLGDGQEGQMIRIDSPYEQKRSKYLLKRKEFVDMEAEVVDIIEGTGNRSGMFGYAKLKFGDKTFDSNARGSEERYIEILKNKQNYIGKSATVRYQNLTSAGIPRFPVIINWAREDYE